MKLILALIALPITGAACSSKTPGPAPTMNQAVVYGQVTLDTGGPARRAAMFALATPLGISCVQDTLFAWGNADTLGRYRLTVFGALVGDSGCIFVGALFPPQGPNAKDTVLGPFRSRFKPSQPFDSVHVDIVIRH